MLHGLHPADPQGTPLEKSLARKLGAEDFTQDQVSPRDVNPLARGGDTCAAATTAALDQDLRRSCSMGSRHCSDDVSLTSVIGVGDLPTSV